MTRFYAAGGDRSLESGFKVYHYLDRDYWSRLCLPI